MLNNKIENWNVGNCPKQWCDFTGYWKIDKINDYTGKYKEFIVNDHEEHQRVFKIDAPEWFKQWEHADDYSGFRAY